ncbi:hypothetical protein GUJ93_ZPchr0001g30690 [Zizania palustris]|uniref:Uncharacterized protein n=1 Tax=Zizania palustris TaxID=103762 RepID=A0A8J5SDR3_ZIZPA|nr:hypothetical protein GUJ93_ZPchr0001g30690 [Zizania palustris]
MSTDLEAGEVLAEAAHLVVLREDLALGGTPSAGEVQCRAGRGEGAAQLARRLSLPCSEKSTCSTERTGRRSFWTACAAASAVSLRASISRHSDFRSSLLTAAVLTFSDDTGNLSKCREQKQIST